jgi:hypothetical protein
LVIVIVIVVVYILQPTHFACWHNCPLVFSEREKRTSWFLCLCTLRGLSSFGRLVHFCRCLFSFLIPPPLLLFDQWLIIHGCSYENPLLFVHIFIPFD